MTFPPEVWESILSEATPQQCLRLRLVTPFCADIAIRAINQRPIVIEKWLHTLSRKQCCCYLKKLCPVLSLVQPALSVEQKTVLHSTFRKLPQHNFKMMIKHYCHLLWSLDTPWNNESLIASYMFTSVSLAPMPQRYKADPYTPLPERQSKIRDLFLFMKQTKVRERSPDALLQLNLRNKYKQYRDLYPNMTRGLTYFN